MKIRTAVVVLVMIVCMGMDLAAQNIQGVVRAAKGKQGVGQDEIVSFDATVPYVKAIQSLADMCKRVDGKLLIDHSPAGTDKSKPIGVNVESMYWKDALELILRSNQLWYNTYQEYMEIVSLDEVARPVDNQRGSPKGSIVPQRSATREVDSSEYYANIREVTISSIFFTLNTKKVAESGFDFKVTRGSNMNLVVSTSNITSMTNSTAFTASIAPTGSNLTVGIDAALAAFESMSIGEALSRPQVTVRSGSTSRIQVGQDFSVFEKDFSGNTTQKFYPTGTILTVSPRVFKINGKFFIDLAYTIEKSSFTSTATSTVIDRTQASGRLSLLDGEEGYVGGLYYNNETTFRSGIPILKDLPILRYLFGYDSKSVDKEELIVLIKANLEPLLEDRITTSKALEKDVLQERRQEIQKDIIEHSTHDK